VPWWWGSLRAWARSATTRRWFWGTFAHWKRARFCSARSPDRSREWARADRSRFETCAIGNGPGFVRQGLQTAAGDGLGPTGVGLRPAPSETGQALFGKVSRPQPGMGSGRRESVGRPSPIIEARAEGARSETFAHHRLTIKARRHEEFVFLVVWCLCGREAGERRLGPKGLGQRPSPIIAACGCRSAGSRIRRERQRADCGLGVTSVLRGSLTTKARRHEDKKTKRVCVLGGLVSLW
jgi:hypothetical protein